ncbi:MAG: carbonic anhydrase family protein [Bradyrhizobium sp.]|jgi:carbonic anhydrase|uniref:carbonic anhydrase n=1 Tax=Bradyrhizobium sp. TaxID=376 RepID=UPI003C73DCA4
MNRRRALKALTGLALCPLCASAVFAAEGAHWTYEGTTGPDNWGDVDAASKVCSVGSQQSPIDIIRSIKAQLPPLRIAWGKTADTIVNNGHTIELKAAKSSTLTFGGGPYRLLQFHFHRPSEHLIRGKRFPMEVHFVHAHASGALAVIGALMAAGKPNPVFSKIIATMPMQEGETVKADPAINPNDLLPARLAYYRYPGSLTTPPCSETVEWLLLIDPVQVADADIAGFAKLYAMNARPAQNANRRDVLRSG